MDIMRQKNTSWGKVASWYDKKVGTKGHFFHENSLLPEVKEILTRLEITSVVDLGCGQGILERSVGPNVRYLGIDISPELITQARKLSRVREPNFMVADLGKPVKVTLGKFQCAVSMLALQNIENYQGFFENVGKLVEKDGYVILTLNHPYYRIPRASGWEVLAGNSKQIRWVSNYLNVQKIPISMNPGTRSPARQKVTWSFHVPLSAYITELAKAGFAVTEMHEIASPKESVGRYAKRENTAREEIPLFMILIAKKFA